MQNEPRKIDQITDDSKAISIRKIPVFKDNLECIGSTYAEIKDLQLKNRRWKLKLKNSLIFFKDSNKIILWTLAFVSGLILWTEFKDISEATQFCAERPELQECKESKKAELSFSSFSRFMWVFFNTLPIGILALFIKLADDQIDTPITKLEEQLNTSETNLSKLQVLKTIIESYPKNVDDDAELTTLASARELLTNISFDHQKQHPKFGHITLLQHKNINLLDAKMNIIQEEIDYKQDLEQLDTIMDSFK